MMRVATLLPLLFAGAILTAGPGAPGSRPEAPNELLDGAISRYGTLESYADSGTVLREAPGIRDRATFKTYYRRQTLDFYFEHQWLTSENPKTPGLKIDLSTRRRVLWMRNGELQAFSQELGTHQRYPREGGNQTGALTGIAAATSGTSTLIPSLLFAKSDLPGTLRQISEASEAGFDNVDEHRCHRIEGVAAEFYPSGARTNVRAVTVWIDAETLLIRKVFEDTPQGYMAGSYSRLTVTMDPQANSLLDDTKFEFIPPSGSRSDRRP
jgi:hypothetical protein